MLFDVRVLSFEHSKSDPVQALMRVFKIDQASAEQIAHVLPRVVKSGIPLETARRLCHILGAIGAQTEVVATGARAKAMGVGDAERSSVVEPSSAGQFVLPRPSPEALGPLLSRTPENANAVDPTTHVAIRLNKIRAKRTVTEVPMNPDSVRRDSSLYTARVRPGSAPDPAATSRVPSDPGAGLEADIAAPRSSEPKASVRPARKAREPSPAVAASPQPATGDNVVLTASVLSALMLLSLSVITLGALPLILLGCFVYDVRKRWALRRSIEASAVLVSASQLPALHGSLRQFEKHLALSGTPRLFVAGGIARGLSSVTLRGQTTLLLSSETLAEHTVTKHADVVVFMLAHELSAVSLGQRKPLRAFLSWLWPAVRKHDVLSADALCAELLGQRRRVEDALLTLLTGPRALALFDRADLERQAAEHDADSRTYAPALPGQAEFLLSRLHRVRRAS